MDTFKVGDHVSVVRGLTQVEAEVLGRTFTVVRVAAPHGFVVVSDAAAPYGERHLMPEALSPVLGLTRAQSEALASVDFVGRAGAGHVSPTLIHAAARASLLRLGLVETFEPGRPYPTRLRVTAAGVAWLAGKTRGAYGTVL